MNRALFAFHAPGRSLAKCAAIAALLSALACAAGFASALVPWLACAAAWTAVGGWNQLMIPAPGAVERSWPISAQRALWSRVLAAWSFCWVPALATLLTVSTLYVLGRVTTEHWQMMFGQTACLMGLLPLCSAALHSIDSRPVAISVFAAITALVAAFIPFAGLLTGVRGIFPGWQFDVATIALACGLVQVSRVEAQWEHRLFAAIAGAPFTGRARPQAATVLAPAPASKVTPWTPLWFFYRRGLSANVVFILVGLMALMTIFVGHVSVFMWTMVSQSFVISYLGSREKRNAWVGYLPISRDRQFAWIFAPLCGLALVATGIEAVSGVHFPARVSYAHMRKGSPLDPPSKVDTGSRSLEAPALLWRATLAEPPTVRSADGELHHIPSYPVISGWPLRVYNPFDIWQWEDPLAFADHVQQALQEQYRLSVTRTDLLLADPEVEQPSPVRWIGCQSQGLQATCSWPGSWLAVKFSLLAWITWAVASAHLQRRRDGRHAHWGNLAGMLGYWVVVMVLHFATEAVQKWEPAPYTWFEGAVVLGELARALGQHPLLIGSSGLGLLVALYWNLLYRYRSAEL